MIENIQHQVFFQANTSLEQGLKYEDHLALINEHKLPMLSGKIDSTGTPVKFEGTLKIPGPKDQAQEIQRLDDQHTTRKLLSSNNIPRQR